MQLVQLIQSFKPDIPFSREDANRFLPWVVGLMVCLSGLFLAGALSVHDSSLTAGRLNADSFQIYVPHHLQTKVVGEKITGALRTMPEVKQVSALRNEDIAALIAPWTGRSLELDHLPLPLVLEVTLKDIDDRAGVIERITSRVAQIDEAIEVESYQQWVDQLMQFTGMVRVLAAVLALLILGALSMIIMITARTSLKLHYRTVQLLHHIGASDDYILRQFVVNGVWMMLRGALPGAGIAAILYMAMAYSSSALSSPLLPQIAVLPAHVAMFMLLPLFTAAAAYVAVRLTVQRMLAGMH